MEQGKRVPKYILEKIDLANKRSIEIERYLVDVAEWIAANYSAEAAENWRYTSGMLEHAGVWFEPPDAQSLTLVQQDIDLRKGVDDGE